MADALRRTVLPCKGRRREHGNVVPSGPNDTARQTKLDPAHVSWPFRTVLSGWVERRCGSHFPAEGHFKHSDLGCCGQAAGWQPIRVLAPMDEQAKGDTGLSELVMLLRFHGLPVDVEQLRHRFGTAAPIGIPEMLHCAKEFGLKARAITTHWTRLWRISLPAIGEDREGEDPRARRQARALVRGADLARPHCDGHRRPVRESAAGHGGYGRDQHRHPKSNRIPSLAFAAISRGKPERALTDCPWKAALRRRSRLRID